MREANDTTSEPAGSPVEADILCGPGGESLLRFMRSVFFDQATPEDNRSSASRAERLGWVRLREGRPRLTPLGAIIADSAREYCNWLDDGRDLPLGLTPDDVRGHRVLDLGCGFGRHLLALETRGATAIGVDLGEPYLRLSPMFAAREGRSVPMRVCATGEKLPIADAQIDLVLCIRSISYMDVRLVLREAARVLVDGGRLMIVASPLRTEVVRFLAGLTWRRGLRDGLRTARLVANSVAYQWFGKRLAMARRDRPTGSPVHVAERFLHRWMRNAGFEVHTRDLTNEVVVGLRRFRGDT